MRRTLFTFALALTAFIGMSFANPDPVETSKKVDEHGLTWYTKIGEAHSASKTSNKPIFAFFTGSDWCGWCIKLQKDVFAKEAFISWAKDNVILLELDFPRRKQLPADLKQQNQNLQRVLGVRGYPTVWIINTALDQATNNLNIAALGSLGYPSGATKGKEEVLFLSNANKILANGKKSQ